MTELKSDIEMALRSTEGFSNAGKLSANELKIAEHDGVIDQDEIRALRSIISRIDPPEVSHRLRDKLT